MIHELVLLRRCVCLLFYDSMMTLINFETKLMTSMTVSVLLDFGSEFFCNP